tara:strand:+ start:317 stop:583 length:267 start_codon:yes stop_codon:yes gene_type:complete
MLTLHKSKLWKGTVVSIRDYELERAKQLGGLIISHNGQTMTLGMDRLKTLHPVGQVHKSKTGGRDYRLVDITFKPDNIDERQKGLFNG